MATDLLLSQAPYPYPLLSISPAPGLYLTDCDFPFISILLLLIYDEIWHGASDNLTGIRFLWRYFYQVAINRKLTIFQNINFSELPLWYGVGIFELILLILLLKVECQINGVYDKTFQYNSILRRTITSIIFPVNHPGIESQVPIKDYKTPQTHHWWYYVCKSVESLKAITQAVRGGRGRGC